MNSKRLPRRINIGLGYVVEVVLAPQKLIRDIMELEDDDTSRFDGCWVSHLGDEASQIAGVIFIDQSLSAKQRRETYWHELDHGINDIRSWDCDNVR